MYGYKVKLPKGAPISVWACKSSVDRYDWKNRNLPNMIEFAIPKTTCATLTLDDREPVLLTGKSFSCIVGNCNARGSAEDGVDVEVASVAVSFEKIEYTAKELCERDLKERDVLLLPFVLSNLPLQDLIILEKLIYKFISENIKKDSASKMLCVSLVYEMLAVADGLVRKYLKSKRKKYISYYVSKADFILSQRYSEKLTLRSVSDELGITPNYLSSMYKNEMGVSFSDRLCELRMKAAEALVLDGGLSVSNIAQAVGFEDESHLRRRFKQFFGISIKEYRLVDKEQTLYHEKPERKS